MSKAETFTFNLTGLRMRPVERLIGYVSLCLLVIRNLNANVYVKPRSSTSLHLVHILICMTQSTTILITVCLSDTKLHFLSAQAL